MTTFELMAMDAANIKDRLARGEKVAPGELRFLQSFTGINSKKAFNAGKRKDAHIKKQRVR